MAVGFYNYRPLTLPLPPYPKATLRIVERAIAEAWRIICDHPEGGFDVRTADEDRITLELRNCLMNNVLVSGVVGGFTADLFYVGREEKFASFDGSHPDKMPDLHISVGRDVSLPSDDGLFVECKPIDRGHPVGGAYCDKGIIRFVKGEYAWTLTQGMMVGYTSSGYTMPEKLRQAFKGRSLKLRTTGDIQPCPDGPAAGRAQQVHVTVHLRDFVYPSTGVAAPPIILRHLWLGKD